ncbi:MAG: hypothetical protein OEW45_23485 [Deltaproteobacteria bacterium]|nr:hypothetical protein [Deltaproteobacteria bacterium]
MASGGREEGVEDEKTIFLTLVYLGLILFAVPLWAANPSTATAASEGEAKVGSLTELNKQLANPISSLWSIAFQQNNYMLDMGPGKEARWNSNLDFQPVLPVALTEDWNLLTRPVMTLFNSVPHPDPHHPGDMDRTTAFGDTVLMEMFSPNPKLAGNWLIGLGPTFIFPTASSDYTGQGKWQVGPAAVLGYLSEKWIVGAFLQNWTCFAGSGNRPDTNQMNLQPIAVYFLPKGRSIGYSGNVLANWKADSAGDVWTVPLGIGIGKVVKLGPLPVKLALGVQYMLHHPDNFGQRWNIQLGVTPVIPNLIKGALFG